MKQCAFSRQKMGYQRYGHFKAAEYRGRSDAWRRLLLRARDWRGRLILAVGFILFARNSAALTMSQSERK